jgi:hypothetical protein
MGITIPADTLMLENVEITYRNFSGREGQFNPAGVRSFSIKLPDIEQAQALEAMGWKVKYPKPREDGEPRDFAATMPVFVKYHPRLQPPKVKMIARNVQTALDEEAVDVLDFMAIEKCDMTLRAFHWKQPNGSEGIKNMLQTLYVTVKVDELEEKYAHIPEVGALPEQRMIEAGDPFNSPLEDLGEGQYALEQGRGF